MSHPTITQGLNIAAIRGHQGSRTMYQVLVENSVLNNFFTVNMDPPAEKSQRQMDPKHAAAISDYILENPDEYVLGAMIYAVDQECPFTESEIDPRLGVLTIPFGTNLRSLDGQHRRQGLNDAIAQDPQLSSDHTAVLVYVEPEVDKRRQMFSDMNATPKIVAKALNVAFDQRDPFARAAMELAQTHPILVGKVELAARQVNATSQNRYTVGSIYDALKRLQVGPTGRVRKASQYLDDDIKARGQAFFDLIADARKEIADIGSGVDIVQLRSHTILFSSTTLRALSGAVKEAMDALGVSTIPAEFTARLATLDLSPSAAQWRVVGFVSPGKSTPNARNQEVLAATTTIKEHLISA